MIQSFKDRDTAALFQGRRIRRFVNLMPSAHRRLQRLDAATSLADLGAVPGNRLERLHGERRRQHSIRINDHGAFVLCGVRTVHTRSKSWIITNEESMYGHPSRNQ